MEEGTLSHSYGLSASELTSHGAQEAQQFKSKLHQLELLHSQEKEEKARLQQQLDQAGERIEQLQATLDKKPKNQATVKRQVQKQGKKGMQTGTFENQLRAKNDQIHNLQSQVNQKETQINMAQAGQFYEQTLKKAAENKLAKKSKEAKVAYQKAQQAERAMDDLYLRHQAQGSYMLQVEHYKQDHQRLLHMLKQTKEFKDFAEFAQDSRGVTYVPKSKKQASTYRPCKACDAKAEMEDWVPVQAFHLAHDFANKYGHTGFTTAQINKLLADLNRIWREREKNTIERSKTRAVQQVKDLKRQLNMKGTYSEVIAQNEVKRLKNDIKKTYEDLRLVSSASVKNGRRPAETDKYNVAMRIASDFQKENRLIEQQNKELRKEANVMKKGGKNKNAEWLKSRALAETGKLYTAVQELKHGLKQRFEGTQDPVLMERRQEWLIENVDNLVNQYNASIDSLFRNV